jgi:hypothetical protein
MFNSSVVYRHRGVDADPDPDTDRQQNNAYPKFYTCWEIRIFFVNFSRNNFYHFTMCYLSHHCQMCHKFSVFCTAYLMFNSSIVCRHRGADADPDCHVDADPDPDTDRHQNNAYPKSFTCWKIRNCYF